MDSVPDLDATRRARTARRSGEPIAIIDIGSNSVRLVAYEGLTRAPTPIYNEKVLCGLGRHVATTGRLDDEAVERALKALARFRVLCRTIGVADVHVLATAAARDASNGEAFLQAGRRRLRLRRSSCSRARARRSSRRSASSRASTSPTASSATSAAAAWSSSTSPATMSGAASRSASAASPCRTFPGNSPKKARRIVREALERADPLRSLKGRTFYAVGGTWRALARLHQADRGYPLHVMHGYEHRSGGRACVSSSSSRRSKPQTLKEIEAVSEARRPLLAYGAIVLEEIIRAGRPAEISVSVLGVREGLLYEMLDAGGARRSTR